MRMPESRARSLLGGWKPPPERRHWFAFSVAGTSHCDVRAACSGQNSFDCECRSDIRSARYYAGGDGAARHPYHRGPFHHFFFGSRSSKPRLGGAFVSVLLVWVTVAPVVPWPVRRLPTP